MGWAPATEAVLRGRVLVQPEPVRRDAYRTEATRRIVGDPTLRRVAVVVLTTFDTDEHVFDAVPAGAAGFLLKDTEPDDLRRAVRLVAGGDAPLSPAVTRS
jgi:DNA-binding NarL/FixJ family response regulator